MCNLASISLPATLDYESLHGRTVVLHTRPDSALDAYLWLLKLPLEL